MTIHDDVEGIRVSEQVPAADSRERGN